MKQHATRLQAFSLVELSIVLVILGLLTGGILTGQSLIRASELRASIAQLDSYRVAMYTFRDKYFALPGDMPNATAFWGIAGGSTGADNTCYSVESTTQATCNGNNDGTIDRPTGATGNNINAERFRAWQHLANAGLVEGSYTGSTVQSVGPNSRIAGQNVPAGKTGNAMVDLFGIPTITTSDPNWFASSQGNLFLLSTITGGGVFTPEEAWNVDTKLDDGMAGTGKIQTYKRTSSYGPNCASSDTATATYDFTITAQNCRIIQFIR
tara:strand:+ start:202 stop:1002 length:801 start_codon:yes stop_codon:yes gene_type:complete